MSSLLIVAELTFLLTSINAITVSFQINSPTDLQNYGFSCYAFGQEPPICNILTAATAQDLPADFPDQMRKLSGTNLWYFKLNDNQSQATFNVTKKSELFSRAEFITIKFQYNFLGGTDRFFNCWYGPTETVPAVGDGQLWVPYSTLPKSNGSDWSQFEGEITVDKYSWIDDFEIMVAMWNQDWWTQWVENVNGPPYVVFKNFEITVVSRECDCGVETTTISKNSEVSAA